MDKKEKKCYDNFFKEWHECNWCGLIWKCQKDENNQCSDFFDKDINKETIHIHYCVQCFEYLLKNKLSNIIY
jgi:hypothetical protein